MKVKSYILIVMAFVSLTISDSLCYAQPLTGMDLINNAKQCDNGTVSYKGEAIGEVMVRGDHAWLHVHDGIIAISIWAPKAMTDNIRYIGNYAQTGDIVEVAGTFHRACPEHGGDLDIHASQIKIITPGSLINRPLSRKKIRIGFYSFICVMLFIASKNFFRTAHRR
jgi:hypothetical protein